MNHQNFAFAYSVVNLYETDSLKRYFSAPISIKDIVGVSKFDNFLKSHSYLFLLEFNQLPVFVTTKYDNLIIPKSNNQK